MTDMPAPPWPRARRTAPRRTLSQDAVVTAALHVIGTEGAEALSMRRVAQELGTGPASLYAHVSGREELIALAIDRALGGVECPEPDPGRWQEQVKQVMRQARAVLVAHGDLARLFQEIGVPMGGNAARCTEGLLAVLAAAGLPPQVCAYAVDALPLYITGAAAEEAVRTARHRAGGPDRKGMMERTRAYFQALPADRFPMINGMVDELMRDEGDERFEFGLNLLVTGLARYAPHPSSGRTP